MSLVSSRAGRCRWFPVFVLAVLPLAVLPLTAAAGAAAGAPREEMAALLRRSDVAESEPSSFRARILLQGPEEEAPVEIEVWRERSTATLVRFLGATHRGKYLLYLEQGAFFLAPGAREPVKLPRSFRLHGSATLDHVLGLRYSRDFSIESAASEDDAHVVFELRARDAKAQYPQVRYVVERATSRPTRAELRLRGGKLATTVEFVAWAKDHPLRPLRLVLRDELRGGRETRVELRELEPRPVPQGLFSLSDGTARRRLEEQEPATTP
jgi:hypothetical protein